MSSEPKNKISAPELGETDPKLADPDPHNGGRRTSVLERATLARLPVNARALLLVTPTLSDTTLPASPHSAGVQRSIFNSVLRAMSTESTSRPLRRLHPPHPHSSSTCTASDAQRWSTIGCELLAPLARTKPLCTPPISILFLHALTAAFARHARASVRLLFGRADHLEPVTASASHQIRVRVWEWRGPLRRLVWYLGSLFTASGTICTSCYVA